MATVKIIPTVPDGPRGEIAVRKKLRVAAYCRVSTELEEQATSYETQIGHYREYIVSNPEWSLAGIYSDDGISGTGTKNRDGFNRMIADCHGGKIDLVITKSISRFARNTLDCLKYIRELKALNIPVYFEKESINTLDAKGEILLTIMASLAQQESQSLSQNVKLGLQYRYRQGKVQINHNHFLGCTKDEKGNLIIDPPQAEIVRRIYREYLEGRTLLEIKRGLERDGVLNGAGRTKWWTANIRKILSNEKYIGDALLQKTYTVDFLTKTRVMNNGIMPQYYVENNHEPIIPKAVFLKVQEEHVRRSFFTTENGRKRHYRGRHDLANLLFCAGCKDVFRRLQWDNNGSKSTVWRCISRIEPRGIKCRARTLREEVLEKACFSAFSELLKNMSKTEEQNKNVSTAEQLDIRSGGTEFLRKTMVLAGQNKDCPNETADPENDLLELCPDELKEYVSRQRTVLTESDALMLRRWLQRITVFDDRLQFDFRTGFSVEIEA